MAAIYGELSPYSSRRSMRDVPVSALRAQTPPLRISRRLFRIILYSGFYARSVFVSRGTVGSARALLQSSVWHRTPVPLPKTKNPRRSHGILKPYRCTFYVPSLYQAFKLLFYSLYGVVYCLHITPKAFGDLLIASAAKI